STRITLPIRRCLLLLLSPHHLHLHSFPTRRSSDLLPLPRRHAPLHAAGTAGDETPRRPPHARSRPVRHGDADLPPPLRWAAPLRSEEHTSELQSRENLVCRLLLEKKKRKALR